MTTRQLSEGRHVLDRPSHRGRLGLATEAAAENDITAAGLPDAAPVAASSVDRARWQPWQLTDDSMLRLPAPVAPAIVARGPV